MKTKPQWREPVLRSDGLQLTEPKSGLPVPTAGTFAENVNWYPALSEKDTFRNIRRTLDNFARVNRHYYIHITGKNIKFGSFTDKGKKTARVGKRPPVCPAREGVPATGIPPKELEKLVRKGVENFLFCNFSKATYRDEQGEMCQTMGGGECGELFSPAGSDAVPMCPVDPERLGTYLSQLNSLLFRDNNKRQGPAYSPEKAELLQQLFDRLEQSQSMEHSNLEYLRTALRTYHTQGLSGQPVPLDSAALRKASPELWKELQRYVLDSVTGEVPSKWQEESSDHVNFIARELVARFNPSLDLTDQESTK